MACDVSPVAMFSTDLVSPMSGLTLSVEKNVRKKILCVHARNLRAQAGARPPVDGN